MSSPPTVLDEGIVERLINAVDRTTSLGKRDYAMLLLAARYGLRPSDIRGLRLDDIRWRERRVVILQSKTQRVLELPLTADVDEALADYLRNGRPASSTREVFVRHKVPTVPFVDSNSLWRVMQRAFKAAGIDPPPKQRGIYLLRHTLATRMLGRGVPFETISDVLGHASVDTTRMRLCVVDRSSSDPFFPGPDGHGASRPASLYRSFRRALDSAGIAHGGCGEGPRLHDLRHGFAMLRLLSWYEQGENLSAKLPLLATYLGHIELTTSQLYLHMTDDLTGEVTRRHEAHFGHLITAEVSP